MLVRPHVPGLSQGPSQGRGRESSCTAKGSSLRGSILHLRGPVQCGPPPPHSCAHTGTRAHTDTFLPLSSLPLLSLWPSTLPRGARRGRHIPLLPPKGCPLPPTDCWPRAPSSSRKGATHTDPPTMPSALGSHPQVFQGCSPVGRGDRGARPHPSGQWDPAGEEKRTTLTTGACRDHGPLKC